MKKILQCVSTLNYGGTEMVVYNYLKAMDRSDLQIDVLVLYNGESRMEQDFVDLGCNIYRLKSKANSFFARPKELKEFFKNGNYDVVHIHSMSALKFRYASIAKKAGVKKVVYHSHSSDIDGVFKILHNLSKGQLNKWCDEKLACSDIGGKFMYKGDFKIFTNAIDLKRFAFNSEVRLQMRKKYNVDNKIVIGHVGRLNAVKNHKFLIAIAKTLKELGREDFVFVFCGDGDLKDSLKEEIAKENLTDKFIFTGIVKDVHLFYNMFDVVAFPSIFEGFGIVMVEAQANGCPVVGSDRICSLACVANDAIRFGIEETNENYVKWATKLIELAQKDRYDAISLLKEKGFDIVTESQKLKEIYLS